VNTEEPVSEYIMVMRLAEQYLIRSEARVQQGKLELAIEDLNLIRSRAKLANKSGNNKSDILTDILHERKVELFTEWGHRWFDLKRTENLDDIMKIVTPTKGGVWRRESALLPIPASEILINSNLLQNPGYN
jgi:hypothetical protein